MMIDVVIHDVDEITMLFFPVAKYVVMIMYEK